MSAVWPTFNLMRKIDKLKSAANLSDVAQLLDLKAAALSHLLYVKSTQSKYIEFEIPKKSGGTRKILAPAPGLKLLQRKLASILNEALELDGPTGYRHISHGYMPKLGIVSNALNHRSRHLVFNTDLQDFFPSIHLGRVRGLLIKDERFNLNPAVATIVAQIACCDGKLPQGSPSSPVISNLMARMMDIKLVRLAKKEGCTYTRYVDDITFSTNKKNFPPSIAVKNVGEHAWEIGLNLSNVVKSSGFSVNSKKTRMQYKDSRQVVTGLTVNRLPNVSQDFKRSVREKAYSLFTTGSFYERVKNPITGETVDNHGTLDQLHGLINHIDAVYCMREKIISEMKRVPQRENLVIPGKFSEIYKNFLLYKYCFSIAKPTIFCEGETDNIYIKHALRARAAKFPLLASSNGGNFEMNVNIINYSKNKTGSILGIYDGGADALPKLIQYYIELIGKKFKTPISKNPVLFIYDNDDGAKKFSGPLKKVCPIISAPFTRVKHNIYAIPTPLIDEKKETCIEDFFYEKEKSIIIDGKKFNPSNSSFNSKTDYSKVVFAHKVVAQNAENINFEKFDYLFDAMEKAIKDAIS